MTEPTKPKQERRGRPRSNPRSAAFSIEQQQETAHILYQKFGWLTSPCEGCPEMTVVFKEFTTPNGSYHPSCYIKRSRIRAKDKRQGQLEL